MAGFDQNENLAWEPEHWFVTFHERSDRWWVNWFAGRRFKHVTAFGYVASAHVWVFMDVLASRMRIRVVDDRFSDGLLAEQTLSGVVVKMPPKVIDFAEIRLKWGFWCVPAVAHLTGMGASALRPDALYRQCLANGGEIVRRDGHEI